jgi:prepilin-type processing-associated H-X9-DG protein
MNTLVVGQSVIQFAPHDPCVPVWERLNEQLRWTNTVHVGPWGRLALVGDYGWWMEWMPWGQRTVEWHGRARHHNVAFLDGHADFLRIRKGLHVTPDYTVVPFKGLVDDFQACQKEVKGE